MHTEILLFLVLVVFLTEVCGSDLNAGKVEGMSLDEFKELLQERHRQREERRNVLRRTEITTLFTPAEELGSTLANIEEGKCH